MIIVLTIVFMIIIGWSLFSIYLCTESGDMEVDYGYDGLLTTIAKIYWWIILVGIMLLILWGISYFISASILCETSHNEYDYCEIEKGEK